MKTKSTLLFLSVLLLVLMIGIPTAQSQFRDLDEGNPDEVYYTLPGGGALVLTVEMENNFDLTPSPGGGGAFYIGGAIFDEGESSANGDTAIGHFDCWVWFQAAGTAGFVLQEWNLFGVGKLQLQGAEDGGPRAITGGTGQFRNARGEATGFEFFEGYFEGTFKIIGAGS